MIFLLVSTSLFLHGIAVMHIMTCLMESHRSLWHYSFYKKIYLFEMSAYKYTEREINFPPTSSQSPQWPQRPWLGQAKSRVNNYILSHMWAVGAQVPQPLLAGNQIGNGIASTQNCHSHEMPASQVA